MKPGTRRRAVTAASLAAVALLVIVLSYAVRVAAIGVAYKAKMLCSGIFVAGRDPGRVLADLELDDLAVLRHVTAAVDRQTQSVTATALGIIERRATHRPGAGCALTPNDAPRSDSQSVPLASPRIDPDASVAPQPATGALRDVIDRAFAETNPSRPKRTLAVVIIHRGEIVAEQYADGIQPDTPLIGWSMAKSVINALVGVLVRQERLSLQTRAPVPRWQGDNDQRAQITIDHLLRMSSGLRFDEDMTNPLADVSQMLLGVGDMAGYAANKTLESDPATKWHYSSGTTNILAGIIRTVLNDDPEYLTFPRRALFEPLGMDSAVLEADASGTFVGSSFMYATARDWARFGVLYLQDGIWNGNRILPEGWVTYSRSPAPADPRRHYGAHFWLQIPDEYRKSDEPLPGDAFHAAGHEAQFVTIIPSRSVVIVRLGRTRYADAWDHAAFVREILAALPRVSPA